VTGRGALLCGFQKRAKVLKFGDQPVLSGDHLVGALALTLEVRPVTGRALPLGGEFGFERMGVRPKRSDELRHRLVTTRQWFVLQLLEIHADQCFAIVGARARKPVAFDDGARGFRRYAQALGELHVGELLDHRLVTRPNGAGPSLLR
jgi:hypothetical protein